MWENIVDGDALIQAEQNISDQIMKLDLAYFRLISFVVHVHGVVGICIKEHHSNNIRSLSLSFMLNCCNSCQGSNCLITL